MTFMTLLLILYAILVVGALRLMICNNRTLKIMKDLIYCIPSNGWEKYGPMLDEVSYDRVLFHIFLFGNWRDLFDPELITAYDVYISRKNRAIGL